MKKLFLLLASGSIAFTSFAQERVANMCSTFTDSKANAINVSQTLRAQDRNKLQTAERKTTVGGSRWYNYTDVFDTTTIVGGGHLNATFLPLWNDTAGQINYTSGLGHNTMVSMGNVLHPQARFNDSVIGGEVSPFVGSMKITNSDSYTVDSIAIFGLYGFNPAKTSVKDTLRLSFTHGNGSGSSDIYVSGLAAGGHYGAINFANFGYDSVKNRADTNGVNALNVQDIVLTSADWGDTSSNGIFGIVVKLNTPVVALATEMVGVSLSFKSGDPAFVNNDTLLTNHNPGFYRYNMFRPFIVYSSTGGTTPSAVYPPFSTTDHNEGVYKTLPNFKNGWQDDYIPMWAWGGTGSNGATYQYPDLSFHVTCTTCGTVTYTDHTSVKNYNANMTVTAVPNPAQDVVNISYSQSVASDVAITLTNMVGQVVDAKNVSNTAAGKVTFNVANLANGVYMYSLVSNGSRATGRILVSH